MKEIETISQQLTQNITLLKIHFIITGPQLAKPDPKKMS